MLLYRVNFFTCLGETELDSLGEGFFDVALDLHRVGKQARRREIAVAPSPADEQKKIFTVDLGDCSLRALLEVALRDIEPSTYVLIRNAGVTSDRS